MQVDSTYTCNVQDTVEVVLLIMLELVMIKTSRLISINWVNFKQLSVSVYTEALSMECIKQHLLSDICLSLYIITELTVS